MMDLQEQVDLEQLLGSGHLECEMNHADTECMVEVSHMAIDCKRGRFVCRTAAASIVERMEGAVTCVHCMRYGRDCWRVVPV
jgi:hypothetical protein